MADYSIIETATISLKRLFEYQETITKLEKVVKHQAHLEKVADALDEKGFSLTSDCDGNKLIIIVKTP